MPPKTKFTREMIIAAAVELVRSEGMNALTARGLAAQLGTSAKPIFGLFQNMDEVRLEVIAVANAKYQAYIHEDMSKGEYPPYKASGMGYVRFAKEERELFKLLFMRDRSREEIIDDRASIQPILNLIRQSMGISEEEAIQFHLEMWIVGHGLATMIATSYLEWDDAFISTVFTDAYMGIKHRFMEGKKDGSHQSNRTDQKVSEIDRS